MGFLPNSPDNGGLGGGALQVREPIDKTIVDNASALVTYYGRAHTGALTSDAVWQISRRSRTGNLEVFDYADISIEAQAKGHFQGKFDKVWDDRVSLFTGPATYINGSSINFDGVNDFILIGDVAALKFTDTSKFTLSAWFRTSVAGEQAIFSKQGAVNAAGYRLVVVGGLIQFHLSDGTGRIEIESVTNTGLDDDVFHSVVVTYDGSKTAGNCTMVVDGIRDIFTTNVDTLTGTIDNLVDANIGARNSATLFFDGFIDEVGVHDTNIPLARAISLSNNGIPQDLTQHKASADLIGYWRMGDGDTFPNILDNSTNNNTGVMTNMVAGDIVAVVP